MANNEDFPRTVCSTLVRASEGCISRKVTCLDKISILYLSPWAVVGEVEPSAADFSVPEAIVLSFSNS